MKIILCPLVVLSMLATNAAWGSVLTTSASCTTSQGTTTGATSCAGSANSTAAISESYSIAGSVVTFLGSVSASSVAELAQNPAFYDSASAMSTLNLSVTTSGPVRAGFVEIDNLNYNFGGNNGSASVSYSLTSASNQNIDLLTCQTGGNSNGGPNCPTNETFYTNPVMIPISLGTTLQLVSSESAVANSGNAPAGSVGVGGLDVTLQFFEADDFTPVAVVVPEPSVWGLIVVGVAMLMAATYRNKLQN